MGLIIPRNPLGYPGGNPGFNSGHLAAKGIRLSFVANPVGGVPKIITAPGVTGPFTVHGTVTSSMWTTGPAITATGTAANYLSIPAINETPAAVTFGAIVSPVASVANGTVLSINGGTAQTIIEINSLQPQLYVSGTSTLPANASTILTVGHSYFFAGSFNGTIGSLAIVDLGSGKITAISTSIAKAFATPTLSLYNVMSLGGTSFPCNSYISAFSYSINNSLNVAQLFQWAQAPWDFWYPPTLRQTIFSSLNTPIAAPTNTATLAYTEPADTIAITAAGGNSAPLAYTEAPDTVAITAALATVATLAYTEPADAITIAASANVNVSLAYTEPPDTVAIAASANLSASLGYTEPPDSVAIAITAIIANLNATLAYAEDPDSVSILELSAVTAALAYAEDPDDVGAAGGGGLPIVTPPYWHGPPALWPYRIDFPGPVIYDRVAIQIGGLACNFRIGDIYFRRRALNYLDNIPSDPAVTPPYWKGPPALWNYRVDFSGPVVYVRTAARIAGISAAGFRIGDIYFRRRALGYLDNIPDNPSSANIPCFSGLAFNNASLAYTEPPDEIAITTGATCTVTVLTTLTGGSTWTVPDDWNSADNKIEAIGSGQGGGFGAGAGGGGGAYTFRSNVALTPGTVIPISIGDGGISAVGGGRNGLAGYPTTFGNPTDPYYIYADYGGWVAGSGGGGVGSNIGGSINNNVPMNVGYNGGGSGGYSTGAGGGGGGGAAGPKGVGGNGGMVSFAGNAGGGGAGCDGGGAGQSPIGTVGGQGGTAPAGIPVHGLGSGGGGGNGIAGIGLPPGNAGRNGSNEPLWFFDSVWYGPGSGGGGGGGGVLVGGAGSFTGNGGDGGIGGGGGAGGFAPNESSGAGGQGIIVITNCHH